tara:strand:+ start:12 stop:605 length:594 start_codon:yes stop_codon:yes gene_type:complete
MRIASLCTAPASAHHERGPVSRFGHGHQDQEQQMGDTPNHYWTPNRSAGGGPVTEVSDERSERSLRKKSAKRRRLTHSCSRRYGNVLNEKYSYNHTFLAHQRNYVEALISTNFQSDSKIDAQLVGQFFARVGCLVGPVIGKVTDERAIILIEVDHEAPICCKVADVISGAVLRSTKLLPARTPYAFVFDGLEVSGGG